MHGRLHDSERVDEATSTEQRPCNAPLSTRLSYPSARAAELSCCVLAYGC